MVRPKDADGIKSNLIITEVQKRPCLFDTNSPNYGDRAEKARSWEEVCSSVVPSWATRGLAERFAAGKEVQKRWRSIRDSYTKAYRQGKCVTPEECPPGSRRYNYHKQMSFLLRALQNKKPRYSQDKYESQSEVSNSPPHQSSDEIAHKIKNEIHDKPLDLKTKPAATDKQTYDKYSQAEMSLEQDKNVNPSLEIKIDANPILAEDQFDDDKQFMNSILPLFKKMNDDTRLLCRIEVLKIIRYALQGHKSFEALKIAEDRFYEEKMRGILSTEKETNIASLQTNIAPLKTENKLSMTTRSADGSRPTKRKNRSPSPLPMPTKKRGPGRPRKIRPLASDSEEEPLSKRRRPKTPGLKVNPMAQSAPLSEIDDSLNKATSVAQLSTPQFMKVYNLGHSTSAPGIQVTVKTEPVEDPDYDF